MIASIYIDDLNHVTKAQPQDQGIISRCIMRSGLPIQRPAGALGIRYSAERAQRVATSEWNSYSWRRCNQRRWFPRNCMSGVDDSNRWPKSQRIIDVLIQLLGFFLS